MASISEMNAGYDVMHRKMKTVIDDLLPAAPFMFRGQIQTTAYNFLDGAEGKRLQLEAVREVLEAAEKARAK